MKRFMRAAIFPTAVGLLTISGSSCSKTTIETGTGGQTTVFEDSFTGADGSSLASDWIVTAAGGASFDIDGNRAYPSQGGGASPSAFYGTVLDKVGYTATVDIIISGGSYTGDAFIISQSTSASSIENSYACGLSGSTGKVSVVKVVSGSATTLATSTGVVGALGDGTTATLSLDSENFLGVQMNCTLTVNGTEYTATAADGTFLNAGYWGLFGGSNGGNYLYFDNFKIVN
jgi:hypothetical protein